MTDEVPSEDLEPGAASYRHDRFRRHIAISGDIGSGKSSVARILSRRTGLELISAGEIQRTIATVKGVTTLELNHLTQQQSNYDTLINELLAELGHTGTSMIFDSRLAWLFVPCSLKIYLSVDIDVAARRLFTGRNSTTEHYETIDETRSAIQERAGSERKRFLNRYGVDIACMDNYDIVVETSDTSVFATAAIILSAWGSSSLQHCRNRITRLSQGVCGGQVSGC